MIRTRITTAIALAWLLLSFLSTPSSAQTTRRFEGHWEGPIKTPAGELVVQVDLHGEDAALTGTISIPVQRLIDRELNGFRVREANVTFAITGIPGDPTFDGALRDEGAVIDGTFTQGGAKFPFRLERRSTERSEDEARELREDLEAIRAGVRRGLEALHCPAIGLAIVRGDEIVLTEGFGLCDPASERAADADTLFAIGSSSKAFTATVIGSLVDEGKLSWKDVVAEILPGFRLKDDVAQRLATPIDLLCHRVGLPRHDLAWYGQDVTRAELFARIGHLEPNATFRERWQYQNFMFLAAGVLAEHLTGDTWETLVQTRIFDPLGMHRANFSVVAMQADANHAVPTEVKDDAAVVMPFRNIDAMGPAGSINASAHDMAHWVRWQLGDGTVESHRILRDGTLRKLHRGHMLASSSSQESELSPMQYGLGWMTQSYRGKELVHHGGNIDGFSALVAFLPQERIGVCALTNQNGSSLPRSVAFTVFDHLLDLEPVDWIERAKLAQTQMAERIASLEKESIGERVEGTSPGHPLAHYAGNYVNEGYGEVHITLEGEQLRFAYGPFEGELEHWHYDVFRPVEDAKLTRLVTFRTEPDGNVLKLEVPLETEVAPIVFVKSADPGLQQEDYLKPFVGTYELAGREVRVVLESGRLVGHVEGQSSRALIPIERDLFQIEGLEGYRVRFEREGDAPPTTALFVQPNGTFRAKRVD
ncbi:MAG: serine hydrolase [Planctomycetes bacterium]|nr:serine hydrolase [Planctomycetota bacterium]